MKRIGIIGGGASGIMAAIAASSQETGDEIQITLIEKNARIGKKILATGNGKCNFTNKAIKSADYYSQSSGIFDDYLSQFDQEDILRFFREEGMLVKEKNGYYYPRSEQASTVLDVLRKKLDEYGVVIRTECYPVSIASRNGGFEVRLNDDGRLFFHRLILACGSFAGQKRKESPNGYEYALSLGHTLVPVVPALVQLKAKSKDFKAIGGVRTEAQITLYIDGKEKAREAGELQLTDYGISGIPVFQLSRHAAYGFLNGKRVTAVIDLLPEYTEEEFAKIVRDKWNNSSKDTSVESFFLGFLNKKLNQLFIHLGGMKAGQPLSGYSYERLFDACRKMKGWLVELEGTNPFAYAQICAGGVSMEEISLHMESKLKKGLFFAGEMLDVDGRCGGYNLQWAWTSGYLAGKYAANSLSRL